MYRELTADQMQDVSSVLGVPLEAIGEWSLTPDNGPVKYAIRSTGDIVIRLTCTDKRGHRQQPRIANFTEDSGHYLFCSLNNKQFRLHRIMAEIWLPDYREDLTVNHIDGDKHNNDYHNLEMLSAAENVMYYHNSDKVAEQRKQDYAYHGTTLRGRIHITNGIQSKMIYESDGIPEGWWKGRPKSMKDKVSAANKGHVAPNAGKQMITNGETTKYINPGDTVPEGWHVGGINQFTEASLDVLRTKMTGRTYVHKGKINKRIYSTEMSQYLNDGWVLGMYAEHLDSMSPRSAEYREKMRKLMTGKGNPMFGKHLSDEQRAAISARNKGFKHTEEARKKISQSKLGYHHTDEAKQKMSEAMKGRPAMNKGHIWITDGLVNKQVPRNDLYKYPNFKEGITREKIVRTYVNDGLVNHKIPVTELAEWLSRGYVQGILRKQRSSKRD